MIYQLKENILKLKSTILNKFDVGLIFFLCALLNYRYSIKIIAIFIIYLIRPNFKFEKSRINYFFLLMISLGIINFIISGNYAFNHFTSVLSGILLWIFCALALHQTKLFIEVGNSIKIINSFKVISLINLIFSLIDLNKIIIIVNSINPYTQLSPPPYGIMSGDLIGGMFGESHNVNTCISAILFVFFLYRKNFIFSVITIITLLMTSSNLAVIIVIIGIFYLIITTKDILIKYYSIANLAIIIFFYTQINPYNFYSTISLFSPQTSYKYFKKIDNDIFSTDDNKTLKGLKIDSINKSWSIDNKKVISKPILPAKTIENKKSISQVQPKSKIPKTENKISTTQTSVENNTINNIDIVVNKSVDSSVNSSVNSGVISSVNSGVDSSFDVNTNLINRDTVTEDVTISSIPEKIIKKENKISPQEQTLKINKTKQKESLIKMWDYKKVHNQNRDSTLIYSHGKYRKFNLDSCPGAIISYNQTLNMLLSNSKNLLIGAGTNEFSSRLAFVNSKMFDDSRLFAIIPKYENQLFAQNHKALYKYLQYEGEETHSIIHVPTSGYNQIIGEYGLIGFAGFIFLYLGYFFKQYKKLTYGKYILLLIIPLFAFDYWFERISVMVLFECIMLLDLKIFNENDIKMNEEI